MTPQAESVIFDELQIGELSVLFDDQSPQNVIRWGIEQLGTRLAIVTSFQAEGMVIIDMATRIDPEVRVVTIDTGRLHEETYDFIDGVCSRYGIKIEVFFPDAQEVRKMVSTRGVNLFRKDVISRLVCCQIRKVRPLLKALSGLDGWITGLRREQWASRVNIRKIELDHDHGAIVKLNPLADWTGDELLDYIKKNDVPQHPLYQKGYSSIGCAPCTRPVQAGEDPREGRWWWEKNAPKECGMHCSIETGGFEHELESLLKENADD
ncbi:phosphoadenylyl-sulfate reductase [bacterium]|nr:phosphoadenylyl-sulfate reductase [bacterium]